MNLPNVITIGRILCVPLLAWLVLERNDVLAFVLFLAAGASDALDGYLAKRLGQRTRLGAYLDPLADKLLLGALYVTLGFQGRLSVWLVGLVVGRDILIMGVVAISRLLDHRLRIEPLFISKVNTVAQILLVAVILGMAALGSLPSAVPTVLGAVVAVTTILSAIAYARAWRGGIAIARQEGRT